PVAVEAMGCGAERHGRDAGEGGVVRHRRPGEPAVEPPFEEQGHAARPQVVQSEQAVSTRRAPKVVAERACLPLTGLRVLDVSWVLPGPLCPAVPADCGVEVFMVDTVWSAAAGTPSSSRPRMSFWIWV